MPLSHIAVYICMHRERAGGAGGFVRVAAGWTGDGFVRIAACITCIYLHFFGICHENPQIFMKFELLPAGFVINL